MALFSTILISTVFCYGRYWWRWYGCLPTGTISPFQYIIHPYEYSLSFYLPIYLSIPLSIPPPTSFSTDSSILFIYVSIHSVIRPFSYTSVHLFIYWSIQLQLTTAPTYFHFPSSGRRKSEDKYDISRYDTSSNYLILILSILISISIVVVYSVVCSY